jgi:hypothetical protein
MQGKIVSNLVDRELMQYKNLLSGFSHRGKHFNFLYTILQPLTFNLKKIPRHNLPLNINNKLMKRRKKQKENTCDSFLNYFVCFGRLAAAALHIGISCQLFGLTRFWLNAS